MWDLWKTLLCISALISLASAGAFTPPKSFIHTKSHTEIDLSYSYVKVIHKLEIKNIAEEPQDIYYYPIDNELVPHLALFEATFNKAPLGHSPVEESGGAYNYHKVKLNDLKPGHTLEITIGLIYTDVLKPYPAELSLEEKGTLYFEGSVYPLSAYDQENTLTTIKVRDQNAKQVIIDNGKSSEPSLFGRINNGFLIYGPYDSVDAFSTSKFGVLYSHNYPLTHVTKLERDIWVSHWGASLSIEERYQLTNHAAKLKGTFSRLDWTRNLPTTAQSSVISAIEVQLTESAREIYYTDLVGNVSTSRVAQRGAVKILQLKPRFPIFGGWHYNFTIGWSSDLANYVKSLTTSKDSYILRVPIVEGPLDTTYENVELSFYLPEGSIIEDLETLVPYDSRDDLIVKSFLDTKGRTVVKLHYSKMFDYYRVATVLVKYKYTSEVHYSKPLKLASIIFTGLLTIFLFSKIDISISKKKAKEIQF